MNELPIIVPNPDNFSSNVAKYIGMLLETRNFTLKLISRLSQEEIDFTIHPRKIETIGTCLFHIGAIEYSWILEDIGKKHWDNEKWKYAFALRNTTNIDQIKDKDISFYIETLNEVRIEVLDLLITLDDSDINKIISVDKQKYSIEWILYHVNRHEMYHAGQINLLKRIFKIHNED